MLFSGFLRFGGGDADKLQPAEGEHDHRQRQNKSVPAGGEEAAVFPQIVEPGFAAAVAAEQHPQAEGNHADNRQHLDQREPELRFAIQAYVDRGLTALIMMKKAAAQTQVGTSGSQYCI